MAELAVYAALAASSVSAYSSYQQGKAQERSARASAEFNRQIAQNEAEQKRRAGQLEADRMRRQRLGLTKSQRAGYAKSGVTSEGTPIQVMIQSSAEEELNANLAQYNYEVAAARSTSEANLYGYKKRQASAYKRAGAMSAGASLLRGVSQAAYYGATL